MLVLATACHGEDPRPPGYQGILEHDERVLAFEVPGRVEDVPVRRGDAVAPGQLVARLDDTLERLARQGRAEELAMANADLALLLAGSRAQEVAAVVAEVTAATAAEDLARKSTERSRSLRASGAVSAAEVDRVETELDRAVQARKALDQKLSALRQGARPQEIARAQARVDAARSALALADARLERYALTTKTAGIVLDVHVDPGELAAVGALAATIADVAHPYVEVFVPEGELSGLRVGTKATVRVDGEGAPAGGVVEYVAPKTEFTPRFLFSERERPHLVIRIRVRLEDPDRRLHAGVPAFASFQR
jgi:HlyD family secretion protein